MAGFGKEIHGLMGALDALRGDSVDIPAQQLQALLAVALQPGLTMSDLADRVGMAQSSCSRNVAHLSKWFKPGVAGLDLIEVHEDPRERRRKVMFLNQRGRARVAKALEAMTGAPVDYTPTMSKEGLARL
jgi:DNA-binding MarR family transcriptional regulator